LERLWGDFGKKFVSPRVASCFEPVSAVIDTNASDSSTVRLTKGRLVTSLVLS
jgi:hypothetical protein